MGPTGIDLETKAVAGFGAGDRFMNPTYEGMRSGVDVEEGFSSHRLDDLNCGFELAWGSSKSAIRDVRAVLGADANSSGFASIVSDPRATGEINDQRAVVFPEKKVSTLGMEDSLQKIHGWAAKEPSDEEVGRLVVNLKRRGDLLNDAVFHHHDPLSHSHGLDLVVGHINHGRLQLPVELGDFGTHLNPHLCVEIGKGFIEEENTRLAHDRAADSHALSLPAGKGLGLAVKVVGDAENLSCIHHAAADFLLGSPPKFQSERHVVVNRHVWIERVVLENHRNVAVFRRNIVHPAVADKNISTRDFLQSRDHAQGGGFAATGRADEYNKFPVLDFEVEVADRDHLAAFFRGIGFEDALECNLCHMDLVGFCPVI